MKTQSFLVATGLSFLILFSANTSLSAQSKKKVRAAAMKSANEFLTQAQMQYDSMHYEQAIVLAKRAEAGLLAVFSPTDTKLFNTYLAIGVASISLQPSQAIAYQQKLEAMNPEGDKRLEAGLLFLQGFLLHISGNRDSAWQHYQSAYDRYKPLSFPNQTYVVRLLSNLGVIQMDSLNLDKAIDYFNQSEKMALRKYPSDHLIRAFGVGNRGLAFTYQLKLKEAILDLQHAIQIREQSLPPQHVEITRTYLNLGLAYSYQWDYDNAISNLRKSAIDFLAVQDTSGFAIAVGNIGLSFSTREQFDSAAYYYNWALEIERNLYEANDHRLLITVFNVGSTLTHAGRYPDNMAYLYKAWGLSKPDDPYRSKYVNGLGFAHYKTGELDSAEYYFTKELAILADRDIPKSSPASTQVLFSLANVSIDRGNFEEAADWNQQGMQSISYLKQGAYKQAFYAIDLLLLLEQKARITAHYAQQHPEDVYHVRQWQMACEDAFEASLYFRETMKGPKSRQILLEKGISSLSMGIEANRQLALLTDDDSYRERAFQLAEQSKSQSLLDAMRQSKARSFAGIPDSVLNQEAQLMDTIDQLETYRYEGGKQGILPSNPDMEALMLQIDDLNTQLSALQAKITQAYPKYAQALGKANSPTMKEVEQTLLKPDQTLLEYVFGDSLIHIFLIQSGHTRLLSIPKDFPLEATVKNMTQSGIYGYLGRPASTSTSSAQRAACDRQYYEAARLLYEKLWKPVKQYLGETVIIVPDGVLGYIPFEALITRDSKRPGAFNTYAYLLEDHVISYSYSSTLLQEMQEGYEGRESNSAALVMAPFAPTNGKQTSLLKSVQTDKQQSLGTLVNSETEARTIGDLLKSPIVLGKSASKAYFLTHAPLAHTIHLSTHAVADERNGEYAFLAFATADSGEQYDPLYARSLYNLELQASLIYLSACETGIGELKKGEGMISLARAFAYAGASSIITTLWKVEDMASSEIGQEFYQNWQVNKMNKRKALREAKRSYLLSKRGVDPEGDHPFYWAGLIGIGDMDK